MTEVILVGLLDGLMALSLGFFVIESIFKKPKPQTKLHYILEDATDEVSIFIEADSSSDVMAIYHYVKLHDRRVEADSISTLDQTIN